MKKDVKMTESVSVSNLSSLFTDCCYHEEVMYRLLIVFQKDRIF